MTTAELTVVKLCPAFVERTMPPGWPEYEGAQPTTNVFASSTRVFVQNPMPEGKLPPMFAQVAPLSFDRISSPAASCLPAGIVFRAGSLKSPHLQPLLPAYPATPLHD